MRLRSLLDVRMSPDGERVAYVVSQPSLEKNEHEATLYVVPSAGGPSKRLGETLRIFNVPTPTAKLRWSPDGANLSLLAFDGERPQVFAIPVSGAAPRRLTNASEGVFAFDWAPDSASLAYLTREPMPADEARKRQDKSYVMRVDAPELPTRLVVQSLDGSAPRTLTPTTQYVDSLSWKPDGREIAYSAASTSGFTAAYDTHIYVVPAQGGAPRAVVDRVGMNTQPQFSPDGRSIAFISTDGHTDIMATRGLMVVPAAGGAPKGLPVGDAWVNEFAWAPDSRSIYLQANDGTFASGEHVFEQPIVRVSVADGRAERVGSGPAVTFSIGLDRAGRRMAFKSVEAHAMGDIAVMDASTGRATTITEINPELRELSLGDLKPIKWRSFDGKEIVGLLLTPPGWTAGRRVPMLTYVHGGPGGGFTYGHFPQFMHLVGQVDPYPTQAFASAGYAVFFPMPRGGAGYGEAGQRAIVNAWGETDFKDIMTGVDDLVARGIADPDRLGIMGASYGGFMTNWAVTQTGRFKAASAGASLSTLEDLYYLSEGGRFIVDYFKLPWENRESYLAHSPLTFANRVTTPLLLQHGERDPRAPIAGAWKFYRALNTLGKTVEFDIYPRGGHVLREPMQQREQMRRNLEWFERWIK